MTVKHKDAIKGSAKYVLILIVLLNILGTAVRQQQFV